MFGRIDAKTQHPAVSKRLVSPSGDLAAKRNAEAERFFGNKIAKAGEGNAPAFPMGKPRLMNDGGQMTGKWPKGPDTMGGVIGGKSDKDSYQGVKKRRG